MLQRIQTVWMFLGVLGSVFLFITAQDFNLFEQFNVISMVTISLVIFGTLSIFSYKNRKRQLLLNSISMYINALLIGVLLYWLLNLPGGINFPEKGIEPIFPFLSIVCYLIANSFIRRDERLVKSVDRLR